MTRPHDRVGPKGAPGSTSEPTREWTSASPEEECRRLEQQLDAARVRRDASEVRRLTARLRLLREERRP